MQETRRPRQEVIPFELLDLVERVAGVVACLAPGGDHGEDMNPGSAFDGELAAMLVERTDAGYAAIEAAAAQLRTPHPYESEVNEVTVLLARVNALAHAVLVRSATDENFSVPMLEWHWALRWACLELDGYRYIGWKARQAASAAQPVQGEAEEAAHV